MKKIFRKGAALCALCCAVVPLLACASVSGQTLTGSVRIYGSEPHTWAALVDEKDGKVYLIDDKEKETELRAFQGKRLVLRVEIAPETPKYPPADGIARVISYQPAN
jgi:hypothetical protein